MKKLGRILIAILMVFTLVSPINHVKAEEPEDFMVTIGEGNQMTFASPKVISGKKEKSTAGTKLHYENVFTVGDLQVDAYITLLSIDDGATLQYFDDDSTSRITDRFSPTLNSNEALPGGLGATFKIEFFKHGDDTTPVQMKGFNVTGVDVDGGESIALTGFLNYTVDSSNKFAGKDARNDGFTEFRSSTSTNLSGTSFEKTSSFIATYGVPVSSLQLELRNYCAASNGNRQYSINFGAPLGAFPDPVVVPNGKAPTITIEPEKETYNNVDDDLTEIPVSGETSVDPGSKVTLTITDGTTEIIKTVTVDNEKKYETDIDVSGFGAGQITISASVIDNIGNPASVSDKITVTIYDTKSITFNSNGGNDDAPEGTSGVEGADITDTFPTEKPTKEGYVFKEWNTASDGEGTKVEGYPAKYPSSDTTYYAIYEPDDAEIVFDANGGTGAPAGIEGKTDEDIDDEFPSDTPTRTGYTFDGWNTASAGTGTTVTGYPAKYPAGTTTYYAKWDADEAEIEFDANGGEDAPAGIEGVTDGEINDTFPSDEPTKEGYTFDGWYKNTAGTGDEVTGYPDTFPAGTTTYYAKWSADEAEIVFNANGGKDAPAGIEGKTDEEITATFPSDEPTREGYTFEGWFKNSAGTGDEVTAYPDTFPVGTTTYYAKWDADEAEIVFDANDGEDAPDGIDGVTDETITATFPTVEPTREGYTFTGWNTAEDGTGDEVTAYPDTFPAGTTTYYAQWEADEAEIEFDANGGEDAPDGIDGVTDETITATFPTVEPTREGYTFEGWFKNSAGTGDEVTAYPDTFPAGTTTYYAKWNADDTEIEFNANGGAGVPAGISGKTDETITDTFPTTEPTKEGYIFKEWNTEPDGTGTKVEEYPAKFPSSDVTYYAIYEADDAYIVFNANGGTDAPDGIDGKTDESIADTFPAGEPTRKGFTFAGWNTKDDGTGDDVTSYPAKFPAGTTVYYAEWDKNPAKIRFDGNSGNGVPNGIDGKVSDSITETFPTDEPIREGYTFAGWYPTVDGTGNQVTGYPDKYDEEEIVYFAKWEPNPAEIVFDATGGKGAPNGITGKTDALITDQFPNDIPVRDGYTFDGWYINPVGTGAVTEYPDKYPAGKTTLYAKWIAKPADIRFDANGGTNAPSGIVGVTDAAITAQFPSAVPTRKGYRFIGWNSAPDGTGVAINAYPVTYPAGTTTYYAQWTEEAEEIVRVVKKDKPATPETDDPSTLLLWFILMFTSIATVIILKETERE